MDMAFEKKVFARRKDAKQNRYFENRTTESIKNAIVAATESIAYLAARPCGDSYGEGTQAIKCVVAFREILQDELVMRAVQEAAQTGNNKTEVMKR